VAAEELRNLMVINSVEMFAIWGDITGEMTGRAVNHVYITKILEQTICSKNFVIMYTVCSHLQRTQTSLVGKPKRS
jgi:hypothetical protein